MHVLHGPHSRTDVPLAERAVLVERRVPRQVGHRRFIQLSWHVTAQGAMVMAKEHFPFVA